MEFFSSLKNQNILITGATGFVGKHVLALGLRFKAKLHILTRTYLTIDNVNCWQSELADEEKLREILKEIRPNAILHLAAEGVSYGSSNIRKLLFSNAIGLSSLMEATKNANLQPQIVIAGSGSEYGEKASLLKESDLILPTSNYGISKATATMIANLYSNYFPITVLRMFNIYGPGEKEPRIAPYIISQAKEGKSIELTYGQQIRDYSYVKDIAEVFWRALSIKNENKLLILNVGSGNPITLQYFTEQLAKILLDFGLKADLRFGAKPYRQDETMFHAPDISLLKEKLSWFPTTNLEIGLKEMVKENLAK